MGAYTEIVDFTFTANETSRTFSGLNITKDDFIKVVATIVNPTGADANYRLLGNSSIASNYHDQTLIATGTTIVAARANDAKFMRIKAGGTGSGVAYIKLSENDRLNNFSNHNYNIGSDVHTWFYYNTSSGATFTSGITSLTLTSETNGIGTGSRIQIYRLDAEKVADITTTANATQVDISSLNIGKDSEYLLVADIIHGGGDVTSRINLFPNDLTTESNYYMQEIFGSGTTAGADRTNNASMSFPSGTSGRNLSYVHIKLSEIGAYTFQSYTLRGYGATGPIIENNFVSSTSEAITSITKLNLVSNNSNAIGSGSRFILYKLK